MRIDAVDEGVVHDDTDTPELEGLRLLFGVAHALLVVATEVAPVEGTGEGGDFCGVSGQPPLAGLLTVI